MGRSVPPRLLVPPWHPGATPLQGLTRNCGKSARPGAFVQAIHPFSLSRLSTAAAKTTRFQEPAPTVVFAFAGSGTAELWSVDVCLNWLRSSSFRTCLLDNGHHTTEHTGRVLTQLIKQRETVALYMSSVGGGGFLLRWPQDTQESFPSSRGDAEMSIHCKGAAGGPFPTDTGLELVNEAEKDEENESKEEEDERPPRPGCLRPGIKPVLKKNPRRVIVVGDSILRGVEGPICRPDPLHREVAASLGPGSRNSLL